MTKKNPTSPPQKKFFLLQCRPLVSAHKKKILYALLVFFIFAIAIFTRVYQLSSLPPGIYPDEAVNGTDAIDAVESGHPKLFYPNNYGREGLFMNLIALGFVFFGVNVLTLKMWAVFFGISTVFGMMLLARELFGTRRAGLIAAFLYTTSFWAINFNRISFRANMLPFVLVFSFYFLFRGFRTEKYRDYVLAGLFFGLGMHTYIAFRIAPLILVTLFFAFLVARKRFFREYWKKISIFLVSATVVALPMLLTFYFHPQFFETRSESVSVLSPKVNQGHLWQALWTSAKKTFGMFNFSGDENWRHNIPKKPELQTAIGILFLLGIATLVCDFFRAFRARIAKKKDGSRILIPALLLSWLLAMLLPGLLTYEGLPHAIRTIGALPAALLIATFAAEEILKWTDKRKDIFLAAIIYPILIIAILWSGYVSVTDYFKVWKNSSEIHASFSQNLKNMALYLNNLPSETNKYVIANAGGQIMDDGLPVSTKVVKLLTHYRTPNITYLNTNFDPKIIKSPAKVVLMYYNGEVISKIKSFSPSAHVQKIDPQPGNGTDYFVININ